MQCLKHNAVLSCHDTTKLILKSSAVKNAQERCGTDQAVATLLRWDFQRERDHATMACYLICQGWWWTQT